MAAHGNGKVPSWVPRLASALKDALLPELKQHTEILREHTGILHQHSEALGQIVAVLHEHSDILQALRERMAHLEGKIEIMTGEIRSNLELHDRVSRIEAKLEMRAGG